MLPSLPGSRIIRRRDPRLALYPFALDDASAGVFRDLMTNVNATLSGGSTLLAQEKFRNDFQRLNDVMLGYRASGAVTNLAYASNSDNPSFEGGTAGAWVAANANHAISTLSPWHGSRCLIFTATGANAAESLDLTAFTANAQHTAALMVRANNLDAEGESVTLQLIGDVSGTTSGTAVTLTADWKLASCTKTFAADTVRTARLLCAGSDADDEIAMDAFIIVTGATVPMFEEKECVATSATFPTPITAGEPVSILCFVWTPWAGNDGVAHDPFFIAGTGSNLIHVRKTASNYLAFFVGDAVGGSKQKYMAVDGTNWPAGAMKVMTMSIDANAVVRLALGGTLAGLSAGTGVRESKLPANMFVGSTNTPSYWLNGLILGPFTYRGVAWGDEECQYYSSLQAPPPRNRMVA